VDATVRLEELFAPVSRPVNRRGKRARALRVWTADDQALLLAVARPEFFLAGFRNADLVRLLYPQAQESPPTRRLASAKVSYRLGLLRAHGLVHKLSNTRRYRLSPKGCRICMAAALKRLMVFQSLTD